MDLIAAVDRNWALGNQNQLLVRIPADLKRFKTLTTGHAVILGRKTLETFPGGRPLPGRRNLILSATPGYRVEGAEVFSSLEELMTKAPQDAFVIGGASVYRALLAQCQRAYLTRIDAAFPADCWLPNLELDPDWEVEEGEPTCHYGDITFQYITYRQRKKVCF